MDTVSISVQQGREHPRARCGYWHGGGHGFVTTTRGHTLAMAELNGEGISGACIGRARVQRFEKQSTSIKCSHRLQCCRYLGRLLSNRTGKRLQRGVPEGVQGQRHLPKDSLIKACSRSFESSPGHHKRVSGSPKTSRSTHKTPPKAGFFVSSRPVLLNPGQRGRLWGCVAKVGLHHMATD
jgi:hypothetical protein